MNPMDTACMATSLPMPKNEQAMGISRRDPPVTPDEPQAARVVMTQRKMADMKVTWMPKVLTIASVMTVMVIAAPFILIVAPKGMLTE